MNYVSEHGHNLKKSSGLNILYWDFGTKHIGTYRKFEQFTSPIYYDVHQPQTVSNIPSIHLVDKLGPFTMKKTLGFDVIRNDDGTIYLKNEEAELYGLRNTIQEAESDLLSELQYAWESYVLCNESELHESALKYREWLQNNIEME